MIRAGSRRNRALLSKERLINDFGFAGIAA
jgi:hypothetical protein